MHPEIAFKAEIFSTIADSVYSNTHFKIREAVSNACDNQATTFIITLDEEKNRISLFNDGNGISDSRFKDIVTSFGRGRYRDDQKPEKYFSYFGVGLLSVFKLGEKVSIFSRTSPGKMNLFEIKSKELFSEESGKKKVSDLSKYFEIVKDKSSLGKVRYGLSPLSLKEAYNKSEAANKHFAEYVIEGVYEEEMKALLSEHDELREILPLKPNKKNPELKKLSDGDRKKILRVLNNKNFCPTIEFYYSINKGNYEKWEKYFPQLIISKNSIVFTGINGNFAYYAISAGKKIGERHSLTLRSKNILIKTNTVLGRPGPNQILDSSIRERIYGEVLHKNMKQFIEVTRNEFIKNKEFESFRERVLKYFKPINDELRSSYDKGLETLKYVYDPFVSIREGKKDSPLKEIERQVVQLAGSNESQNIIQCAQKLFGEMRDAELEKAHDVSSYLAKKEKIDLEGDDYILRIRSDIDEAKTEKDHKNNKIIVNVPASTFKTMDTMWFKHSFTVRYVYVEGKGRPYSVDFDKRKLTINPFYQDFQKYSLNFLEVIMTLDLSFQSVSSDDPECASDKIRNCLQLYKESIVKMLTAKYKVDKEENLGKIKRNITDELSLDGK